MEAANAGRLARPTRLLEFCALFLHAIGLQTSIKISLGSGDATRQADMVSPNDASSPEQVEHSRNGLRFQPRSAVNPEPDPAGTHEFRCNFHTHPLNITLVTSRATFRTPEKAATWSPIRSAPGPRNLTVVHALRTYA